MNIAAVGDKSPRGESIFQGGGAKTMNCTHLACGLALAAAFGLVGCGGGGSGDSGLSGGGTTTPVTTAALDVTPCLSQRVAGRNVASLVVPDVLSLDPTLPGGFPNGRLLQDPVVDLELAALFLDLSKTPVDTLAKMPLDPSGNDVPLRATFPYLGVAQGTAPVSTTPGGGDGFVFRTDDPSAYTRIDRMGEPAVATVLVATAKKTEFNDDNPTIDATGKWAPVFTADLETLADELQDDWAARNLPICGVPKST
jgi:hypothetical protein